MFNAIISIIFKYIYYYNSMIQIDQSSAVPLGEQLMGQVRLLVSTGSLAPGSAIPTVHELAGRLKLNPNTVAAAYRELREEGYLTKHGRGGTRVSRRPPVLSAEETAALAFAQRVAGEMEALNVNANRMVRWLEAQVAVNAGRRRPRVAALAQSAERANILANRLRAELPGGFDLVPATPRDLEGAFDFRVIDSGLLGALISASYEARTAFKPDHLSSEWETDWSAGAD